MVRELQRSTGSAGIVVTHDPTDALAIADDLLVLIGGRVRAFGPANEVAARPVDLEVAQLVDDLGMHVVEITETGNCANAVLSPEFRARLSMLRSRASATGSTLVGLRPWQIRVGVPTAPSITFEAELLAREPAGLFTDLIGLRADGRTLRARVPSADAQELPIQSVVAFHVHESDAHLFAAPWPGRRID
jgi:ABC-type sugar transport system ATPase subunit